MATTYEMGFINVPISPTFVGIAGKLNDQLIKPARDAGKKAASEVEKSVEASVKSLERQVAASTKKLGELDRAYDTSVQKREAQQSRLNAAIAEQSAAEEKYQQALKKGDSGLAELAKVEKAKAKVTDETLKLAKAERDITDAEQKHKAQLEDLRRTTEKYEQAQKSANEEAKSGTSVFDKLRQQIGLAGTEMDDTANKAAGLGDKIMSGLGKVGTGALLGVGAKIGSTVVGSINTAFDKGFGRLQSIEQAETMLGGLGHSAEGIAEIMDNAMDSVSGTAYGFGEAASMAATFAGAGIEQGEELTRILSLVGDSAAITGADFQEMGSIWTKMASSGKLSTDEMNQLMDRGLGLLPKLQEHYNVTADEARKMVSDGKVSFQDFAEVMENMVGGSSQAMGDTFSGSAANMQAALGRLGAKFMDPIYQVAPSIFQAIGGSVDKLGEYLGPVIEDFAERFAPVMQDFAERLGPWLEESIDKVAGTIKDMVEWGRKAVDWLKENREWMETAAVSATVLAGGIAAMNLQNKIAVAGGFLKWIQTWTIMTNIQTGAQKALNLAMRMNPIGLLVTGIAALAGGLVWLFSKTDAGQKMWEDFTASVAAGWDFLVGKFEYAIEFIQVLWRELTSAFSGEDWGNGAISSLIGEDNAEIVINILSDLGDRFTSFKEIVAQAFDDIWAAVEPVFSWVADFTKSQLMGALESLWETVQSLAGAWLDVAASIGGSLIDLLGAAWEILKALWDVISPLLIPVLKILGGIIGGVIVAAFVGLVGAVRVASEVIEALAGIISWTMSNILAPLISIIADVISWIGVGLAGTIENFGDLFANIFSAVSSIWDGFTTLLGIGVDFIVATVFGGLGAGLDVLRSSFSTAVDAIGKIWDGLKQAAMAPVKFVVDTVWNDGLLRAINAVTKFIGMDPIEPIQIGFARGGILPGYSRMADGDDQLVPMRQGEGVLVSEGLKDPVSRELFLSANEWAKNGGSFASFIGEVGAGKATGGIINYAGSLTDIQESHARFVGRFFPDLFALTSASRSEPGSMHDYSRGAATDWQAQDGQYASQMPTAGSKALARAIATNFPNTAQLIHWPEDGWTNILNGGPFDYGAGTNAQHGNHVHWGTNSPLVFDGDDIVLTDAPGGASGSGGGFVKGIWDKIVNAITPYADGVGGWFDEIPANFLEASMSKLWDFISEKVSSIFSFSSGGGEGATQWADLASQALARMGYGDEHLDAMLQQIQIESTGDPNAVNDWDSNALAGHPSGGLLQVIEPTYRDVRNKYPEAFEGLPDDRFHPLTNLVAGVGAVKRDWGGPGGRWPTRDGYSEGGIVDLFTRDLGGWVPDGALVRNTSGRDELMLPPELSRAMSGFFSDYPEAASSLADAAVSIESASEWLAQAADYSSDEGAVARAVTRGILGIGIDLPGADLVSGFLDAEEAIWESRLKYSKHIDTIAEKEKALADALEALDELGDGAGELGTKDQRKIDDATAKVEEAKADLAKADSDEKRAKAADKLADAEEKLRRVREDLDESAAKDAKKHAEDITKANEAVAKAESELVEAKRQQASDLHAITILSQDSLAGMESQAAGLANQLISLGAPAAMVTQGLGAVSGALGSVAGMAGPAGLTLGMALDIAKSVIQLVQMLEQMWKEIVEKITTYRTALLTGQADFLAGIAEINSLVSDQKMEIVSLANEWVDATLRMRDAIRGITEAAVGVLSANLEGAKAIADIQKKILDARSGGSGGSGSSGGSAFTDMHDMGLLYDSHADKLTATPRIKSSDGGSSGGSVSDIAASVDEIAALEWELIAAEKNHSIMLIDAMIDMVDAQFEQIEATRNLERLEEDRDRAWARLIQLQEIQTQFAINEQQAIVQEQINELLRQNAEAEAVLMDAGNRLGDWLDFDGDGTFFGLVTNKGSIAVEAAQNTIAANNAQIEKLIAMQQPYGGTTEITPEMQATLEKAARLFAEGMDREAQWLLDSSALGDPARALQLIDISDKLAAIDEKNLAIQREWEDLELRLDHIAATEGLESLREGLQHDREYALASAEILRATSDEVRKAAEALRDYHAQAAAQKPTVVTVHVPAAGTVVDADVLDQTLSQLGQQLDGVEIRTERLESAGKPTGGSVLVSKS